MSWYGIDYSGRPVYKFGNYSAAHPKRNPASKPMRDFIAGWIRDRRRGPGWTDNGATRKSVRDYSTAKDFSKLSIDGGFEPPGGFHKAYNDHMLIKQGKAEYKARTAPARQAFDESRRRDAEQARLQARANAKVAAASARLDDYHAAYRKNKQRDVGIKKAAVIGAGAIGLGLGARALYKKYKAKKAARLAAQQGLG